MIEFKYTNLKRHLVIYKRVYIGPGFTRGAVVEFDSNEFQCRKKIGYFTNFCYSLSLVQWPSPSLSSSSHPYHH